MTQMPTKFHATCRHCGQQFELPYVGGEFLKNPDNVVFVATLDRLDIETHLLIEHGVAFNNEEAPRGID